jgi:hypothetical protein
MAREVVTAAAAAAAKAEVKAAAVVVTAGHGTVTGFVLRVHRALANEWL